MTKTTRVWRWLRFGVWWSAKHAHRQHLQVLAERKRMAEAKQK